MKFEGHFKGREITRRPSRIDVYYDALAQVGDEEIAVQNTHFGARISAPLPRPARRRRGSAPRRSQTTSVRGEVRWANGCEAGGVLLDPVAL